MTDKEQFLAGHHFTIKQDLPQFEYYYDDQHDEGQGMIVHYRGKKFRTSQKGMATPNKESFNIVIKGLLVRHKETISYSDLLFNSKNLVKGK